MKQKFFSVDIYKKNENEKEYTKSSSTRFDTYQPADNYQHKMANKYNAIINPNEMCLMAPPGFLGKSKKGKDVLIELAEEIEMREISNSLKK